MAGTDDPSSGFAGLTLHMEMEMLVESGLTPMQALQSATGWGSSSLLTSRQKSAAKPPVGILAEGAYANLVVLGANPLESNRRFKRGTASMAARFRGFKFRNLTDRNLR